MKVQKLLYMNSNSKFNIQPPKKFNNGHFEYQILESNGKIWCIEKSVLSKKLESLKVEGSKVIVHEQSFKI